TSSYTYGTAPASHSGMDSTATQFSPRLRYTSAFSGVTNEFVAGMDFQNVDRKTKYSDAEGSQKSIALYLRDEVRFGKARIAFGVRHERFDQDFSDPLSFSFSEYDRS